jgi:transcriptional regulator
MYVPPKFLEADPNAVRDLIDKHGFGILVTSEGDVPLASHLLFKPIKTDSDDLLLFAHMARANIQWRSFDSGREVLAIFQGPHTYVSAGWYSVKSAPTWNYLTAHVYGVPQIVNDRKELHSLLKDMVDSQEQASELNERYHIESLPEGLANEMMDSIVGFRILASRIECAAKLSQNRSRKDYLHIIEKLRGRDDTESRQIAEEMESRLKKGVGRSE